MMTVKTVCIEVAILISHKDQKNFTLFRRPRESVRKSPLTPVFKWKSSRKNFPMMTVKKVFIEVALLISHKVEKTSLFLEDQSKRVRKSSLTPVFKWKSARKFFPKVTVKTVFIEVALLISHKVEKTSLFLEDQSKRVRKSSLTPVFKWKSARKFFPKMTVKTVCLEVPLFRSHKDEKTSLFSEDQLKSARKNSLTPVFKSKSPLKFFPMMTVKTVFIEVALLINHNVEKTSLFSEDQLKRVRKSSLTPVSKWKSARKNFPMMTVKTVCIEVALLISHKDQKTSLFSEDQIKV